MSTSPMVTVMVIAKVPEPGRAKTRLEADLGPDAATDVAWACLLDTLDVVSEVPGIRRLLVLDGARGPWIPRGFRIVAQRGESLGDRLAAAFGEAAGPALVIAMDTPQVTAELLSAAAQALSETDAVIGGAEDGGYWLIGLRRLTDYVGVFRDIVMSEPTTGAQQRDRLSKLGLTVTELLTLRDIDTVDDLTAVLPLANGRRFGEIARALVTGGPHVR